MPVLLKGKKTHINRHTRRMCTYAGGCCYENADGHAECYKFVLLVKNTRENQGLRNLGS